MGHKFNIFSRFRERVALKCSPELSELSRSTFGNQVAEAAVQEVRAHDINSLRRELEAVKRQQEKDRERIAWLEQQVDPAGGSTVPEDHTPPAAADTFWTKSDRHFIDAEVRAAREDERRKTTENLAAALAARGKAAEWAAVVTSINPDRAAELSTRASTFQEAARILRATVTR